MPETELLAPIIVGLVEVAKRIGLPTKFCPLLAIALGILFEFLGTFISYQQLLLDGIVAGLLAVGLFSGVRATTEGLGLLNKSS